MNLIEAAVKFLENDEARELLGLNRIRVGDKMLTRGELAQQLKSADVIVQPRIKGYRQLTQQEVALMNRIKSLGEQMEAAMQDLSTHLVNQRTNPDNTPAENQRLNATQPERWMNIGRTHIQQGVMALVRAVAQPTS